MARYPVEEFDVDVPARRVRHKVSGIEFWFDKYRIEQDWQDAGPKAHSANHSWEGDIALLGRCAKAAADAAGMRSA